MTQGPNHEVLPGEADQQFEDAQLQSALKDAFDSVEPSAEAKERMLANLLTYEGQVQGTAVIDEGADDVAAIELSAKTEVAAEAGLEAVAVEGGEGPTAKVVEMPKAKRRVRPWQVLVPAAAVLALVAVVLVMGPLTNMFSFSSAGSTVTEVASTARQDTGEGATEEAAEETSSVPAATADTSTSASYAADNAEVEQAWARDFYTIELKDGTILEIDSYNSPVPADERTVGELLEDAIAVNEEATASIACSVYASTADEEAYLVSFLGESNYFLAHKVEA